MGRPLSPASEIPCDGRYLQSIAPTPLIPVSLKPEGPAIWCKLEFLNPSGSTKDRIARYMVEKAWRTGQLQGGGSVVEASSGSTSIALALTCAQMGLKFTAVMPEGVTGERVTAIRAYGARVELTPRDAGMQGALERAGEIAETEGTYYPRQFENPDNAEAHRVWTGQEILSQIPGGLVHAVVSGVGTGGTLVGLYTAFRTGGCPTVAVAARPVMGDTWSADLECCSFSSRVPGVVDGFSRLFRDADLGERLDVNVPDEVAVSTARELIRRGFPVGPSSGLNYAAALEAAKVLPEGARIVTVFPDRMDRYFSTELVRGL